MLVPTERRVETRIWCIVLVLVVLACTVASLNGPNVCMVKQKYNITKRVKYRAPMSIRTYEWCFSMPPRCSKWNTEMRDLTRLETTTRNHCFMCPLKHGSTQEILPLAVNHSVTDRACCSLFRPVTDRRIPPGYVRFNIVQSETEERTAEVAVCCPGYKMKDVSCVPICPLGKTGHGCSEDCPPNKWGPNCVHKCPSCEHGACSPITGECHCEDGWQGESCSISMPSTPSTTTKMEEILTTAKPTTKTLIQTTTKATEPTTVTTVTEMVVPSTIPPTTIPSTTNPPTTSSTLRTNKMIITTLPTISTKKYNNISVTTDWAIQKNEMMKVPINFAINSNYNRTETPVEISSDAGYKDVNISTTIDIKKSTTAFPNITSTIIPSTTTTMATTSLIKLTVKETATKTESPKKPETTAKVSTTKTKPKEIWIRPTQRGESTFIETKIKTNVEQSYNRYRNTTKNEEISEFTTPKTIIVSIIPTSVSYVTFKKIALTTASYMSQKNNVSSQQHQTANNKTESDVTKKLTTQQMSTAMPYTIRVLSTLLSKNMTTTTTVSPLLHKNITKTIISKFKETSSNTTKFSSASKITNSMPSTVIAANKELNSSNILTTTSSLTNNRTTQGLKTYGTTPRPTKTISSNRQTTSGRSASYETATTPLSTTTLRSKSVLFSTNVIKNHHGKEPRNFSLNPETVTPKLKDIIKTKLLAVTQKSNDTKKNATKASNTKPNVITTAGPLEDETFHILTEPEHITAVMNDKGRDHSSVDLISVISIAGGVMMAVITVAVIIVMVERCKRPRYEDVRKINDIRMQVMIDNNDVPPPYVRSIFHTPLPDPPTSEKCHYQPISTLDRNLKQFMRPVVVQTISPIMLENFRGILECHYDHLPQRNYDCGTLSTRCSVSPSMACTEELHGERALSVTDYTIETMKREAKLDVIDNTTSEPLYAEIPCWRPPSEHAIEVLNLNGEAVTEL